MVVDVDGIILNIIDTAGIRKSDDIVEQMGIEKSLKMIEESDLVLFMLNNNELPATIMLHLISLVH